MRTKERSVSSSAKASGLSLHFTDHLGKGHFASEKDPHFLRPYDPFSRRVPYEPCQTRHLSFKSFNILNILPLTSRYVGSFPCRAIVCERSPALPVDKGTGSAAGSAYVVQLCFNVSFGRMRSSILYCDAFLQASYNLGHVVPLLAVGRVVLSVQNQEIADSKICL